MIFYIDIITERRTLFNSNLIQNNLK